MDYKKLINILVKDLSELDDLILELRQNQKPEPADFEYLHTRTKGIRQIAARLSVSEPDVPQAPVSNADERMAAKVPVDHVKEDISVSEVETVIAILTPVNPQISQEGSPPVSQVYVQPAEKPISIPEEKVEGLIIVTEETGIFRQESVIIDKLADYTEPVHVITGKAIEEPELIEKQEAKITVKPVEKKESLPVSGTEKEEPKILGDMFRKEKSLNDILSDQSKLDSRLNSMPISSLTSSIGINDRFLYIRELFGGDTNRFNESVKLIDTLSTIQDAIEYLKANHQWLNNETSQKFLSLVKRRFSNE
jgi:hypothetical protein